MPTYDFKDEETGEITTHVMKIAELDEFKKNNPNLRQVLGATAMGDPVRLGIRKHDDGFREVLNKIADRTPGGKGLKDVIR